LKARHRSPQGDLTGLQDQVVVVAHQAPREDRPTVQVPHGSQALDERDGLAVFIEDQLPSGDSAVDVVDRARNKKAGLSWHEISPMRGLDAAVLIWPTLPTQVWKCVRGINIYQRRGMGCGYT
jgi:hypothetical protein